MILWVFQQYPVQLIDEVGKVEKWIHPPKYEYVNVSQRWTSMEPMEPMEPASWRITLGTIVEDRQLYLADKLSNIEQNDNDDIS